MKKVPKFNQQEMVTTFTYKLSLMRIDAHNLVIVVTDPPTHTHTYPITHKHTNRQDQLQYTVLQLSAHCKYGLYMPTGPDLLSALHSPVFNY